MIEENYKIIWCQFSLQNNITLCPTKWLFVARLPIGAGQLFYYYKKHIILYSYAICYEIMAIL